MVQKNGTKKKWYKKWYTIFTYKIKLFKRFCNPIGIYQKIKYIRIITVFINVFIL